MQWITMQHNATQLNRYNTTATQRIETRRNATKQTQHNGLQRNTTDTTQQNSPQHNKTGNKNQAHMINKPVEVTLNSTKNSTEKNGQKTLQV